MQVYDQLDRAAWHDVLLKMRRRITVGQPQVLDEFAKRLATLILRVPLQLLAHVLLHLAADPAVQAQATDRAYRIGQHRNVLVHKLVCRGTVEERIDRLIEDKQKMVRGVLAGGGAETLLTEMTDDELMAMVALDLSRATAEV